MKHGLGTFNVCNNYLDTHTHNCTHIYMHLCIHVHIHCTFKYIHANMQTHTLEKETALISQYLFRLLVHYLILTNSYVCTCMQTDTNGHTRVGQYFRQCFTTIVATYYWQYCIRMLHYIKVTGKWCSHAYCDTKSQVW